MSVEEQKSLTIEERIKIIEASSDLKELMNDVLPKSYHEDYYFLSYSHKDYKKVLPDILRMEEQGLHFWYDISMPLGRNWEDIAKTYISKFQCKGVIFYLSENSITSSSCNTEIQYVYEHGINYFSINLPIEGETKCGNEMLKMVIKTPKADEIDKKKSLKWFKDCFNEKVLYVSYDTAVKKKVEMIKQNIAEKELFEFRLVSKNGKGSPLVELTACGDNAITKVTIPSKVIIDKISNKDEFGKEVLEHLDLHVAIIGGASFANFSKLEMIELPSNLVEIDDLAFLNCTSLKYVNWGSLSLLKRIGDKAFSNCISLVNLDLQQIKNKLLIDKYAFANCDSLEYARIDCVNQKGSLIMDGVFFNCAKLRKVRLEHNIILRGSRIFEKCFSLKTITIPNSVRSLESGVFRDCVSLSNIEIPDSVTSFGDDVFYGCTKLTNITIPASLTRIGYHVFDKCYHLVEVCNKSKLSIAQGSADNGCVAKYALAVYGDQSERKLVTDENGYQIFEVGKEKILVGYVGKKKNISIPEGITKINNFAFSGYKQIKKVVIPDSVTSIGGAAFSECVGLKSLQIQKNVTNIENGAFAGCESLQEISLPDSVNYIGTGVFGGCSNLLRVQISKNITRIPSNAFARCRQLESVDIPKGITNIDNGAFWGCSNLISLSLPSTLIGIGKRVFEGCLNLKTIYNHSKHLKCIKSLVPSINVKVIDIF